MKEIIKGITDDRLNELFLRGYEAHPHEVAEMAGELIEHRRCKDCDGVHDGGCVNTNEAKEAPVVKWLKWRNLTADEDPPVPYRKTVNGSVVESIRKDGTVDANNRPWINEEFYISISEAEYLAAAAKPPLMVDCPPVVDEPAIKWCSACQKYHVDGFICAAYERLMNQDKPAAPVVEPIITINDVFIAVESLSKRMTLDEHFIEKLEKRIEAVEKAGRG
jgi:hypothetical protein